MPSRCVMLLSPLHYSRSNSRANSNTNSRAASPTAEATVASATGAATQTSPSKTASDTHTAAPTAAAALPHHTHQHNKSAHSFLPSIESAPLPLPPEKSVNMDTADAAIAAIADAAMRLQQQQQQQQQQNHRTYSTSAYRDFMRSTTGSASNSQPGSRRGSLDRTASGAAADSNASTTQSSAMSSVAVSGMTTQVASPVSIAIHQFQQPQVHQAQALPHHQQQQQHSHHGHGHGQAHHHHRSSIAGQAGGQMSLDGLSLAGVGGGGSASASGASSPMGDGNSETESLGPAVVVRPSHHRVLRPVHFTFTAEDVKKSAKKAAEREHARALKERERVEREREAHQRAIIEREYELAKAQKLLQHERERQARDTVYRMNAQRKEMDRRRIIESQQDTYSTSADDSDLSNSSYSDSGSEAGEEEDDDEDGSPYDRRSPIQPTHFKFDLHDIHKSYAKPSARQVIGHWTTFPKSGTVMYHHHQLKLWIQSKLVQQQEERKLQSAPVTPRAAPALAPVHAPAPAAPVPVAAAVAVNSVAVADHALPTLQQQQAAIRKHLGESSGSLSARGLLARNGAVARRSSLPCTQFVPPAENRTTTTNATTHTTSTPLLPPLGDAKPSTAAPQVAAAAAAQQQQPQLTRPAHKRSRTAESLSYHVQPLSAASAHSYEAEKAKHAREGSASSASSSAGDQHKQQPSRDSSASSAEKNTSIRRGSSAGSSSIHSRHSSAGVPSTSGGVSVDFSKLYPDVGLVDSATLRRPTGPNKAQAQAQALPPQERCQANIMAAAAAAMDATARRSQAMQMQMQMQHRSSASIAAVTVPPSAASSAASSAGPSSLAVSPTRMTGRLLQPSSRATSSTHVSPTRRERIQANAARSATMPSAQNQHHHHPHQQQHHHLPPPHQPSMMQPAPSASSYGLHRAPPVLAHGHAHGGENKIGSSHNSPTAATHRHLHNAASIDYAWPSASYNSAQGALFDKTAINENHWPQQSQPHSQQHRLPPTHAPAPSQRR